MNNIGDNPWNTSIYWHLNNQDAVDFFSIYSNSPYIDRLSKKEASRNFGFLLDIIQGLIANEAVVNVDPELIFNNFYASVLAIYRFSLNHPENIETNKEIAFNM